MSVVLLTSLTACNQALPITGVLESAFPTIEDLGATIYWNDRDCQYLVYRRGAYSASPGTSDCSVDNQPLPQMFDAQARADFGRLERQFGDVSITFFAVDLTEESSVKRGAGFSLGGCTTLFYDPAWSSLPTDDPGTYTEAIDADWYQIDFCSD